MGPEGRLVIDLALSPEGKGSSCITSSRPLGLSRCFVGKPADEAVRTVPLLFSVCGAAQGTAAAEAAEQALGREASAETRRVRRLLVLAETAREIMLALVRDAALAARLEEEQSATVKVMRSYQRLAAAIDPRRTSLAISGAASLNREAVDTAIASIEETIEALILAEPLSAFKARTTTAEFMAWHRLRPTPAPTPAQALAGYIEGEGWSAAGHADAQFLPLLDEAALALALFGPGSDRMIAEPTWQGHPCETSGLARELGSPLVTALAACHGFGLLTRLAARLTEIAGLPDRMRALVASEGGNAAIGLRASSPAPGQGIAQVEAARGRLVHAVAIEASRVARYAILAPTEWNFHPEGGASRGLARIAEGEDRATEVANLFVGLIDPCVAYEVRVH